MKTKHIYEGFITSLANINDPYAAKRGNSCVQIDAEYNFSNYVLRESVEIVQN